MSKEKLSSKAVEFQPDALEIQHERLPWWARIGVWWGLLFMVGAIVWACIGRVDVIVGGEGKLVTDTPPMVLKPLERAVIKTINVRVGEVVKKDQVLVTFDTVGNQSEAARLEAEISTLTAQFERLLAEFEQKEYQPSELNENSEWQLAIFRQRSKYYSEKIKYFDEAIARLQATQNTTRATLERQEDQLDKFNEILEMYRILKDREAVPKKEFIEVTINGMQFEAQVTQLKNNLIEQEHEELSTTASKNSYVEEWRNSISEELVKIQRELSSTKKQYDKTQQLIGYDTLRAPCEAVVHEIASFSTGSAVREAEAMITLIPLTSQLELELEVPPQDISKVKPGSEVRVKLNSFPFQKYGTLDGLVRTISEDTFQKESNEPGRNRTYYRARVVISGKLKLDEYRLIPGMEAQGEVKAGRRRIIEYLVHPLIKSLDEAIREP